MRMSYVLFPSPALLPALPLPHTLLSSVQSASLKYVITKGVGGDWNTQTLCSYQMDVRSSPLGYACGIGFLKQFASEIILAKYMY